MNTEEVIDILQGIKDGTACLMKNMPQRGETAIDTAIDVLSERRWIPVTERLPKKQAKVLVVDFGDVDTAYLNSEGRWMDFNGDKLKDVKAWMPMPKWEGEAE